MSDQEEPRDNGADALSLLTEARMHYRVMLGLLQAHIGRLRDGQQGDAAQIRKSVSDYSGAVALLMQEINKVDRQDENQRHAAGGEPYDFAALRSEIGGRLARLRAATGAGEFSGLAD